MPSVKQPLRDFLGDAFRTAAVELAAKGINFLFFLFLGLILVFAVQGGSIPAWLLVAVVGVSISFAIALLVSRHSAVTALSAELRRHSEYSGHLQNSLDVLQRILNGDVGIGIPYYIEQAILFPAMSILAAKPVADVRLSVLRPDPKDSERWTMSWAAGHSMPGKVKFNQMIRDTLARHAFERGGDQYWPDTHEQTEFQQNPLASHPTRSLISIPIAEGDEVLGVFNAVSSEPEAFDKPEQTFLISLAGVIAVAVGVWLKEDATEDEATVDT